jgi:hypothetical protein
MSVVRRVTTAYPWRVETWECLVVTSTRREYVFMMYAALSMQRELDSLELTTGMSATITDYVYALYNGQAFLLVKNG